jgi:DNA-binding MarR family transcriptional regulator
MERRNPEPPRARRITKAFGFRYFLRVLKRAGALGSPLTRLDNSRYNDYNEFRVTKKVKSRASGRRVGGPEEAAFLDLLRTTDMLSRELFPVLKGADLSPTQYNVLRILRGAPEGLPCGEIASRMITRDPDVTRLLDRLEKRELISRCRETNDRRTVMVRTTAEGLRVLARLDEPVQAAHRKQLGHLGRERLRVLTELLRFARSRVA